MKKYISEREMHKNFLLKDGDYKSTKEVLERIAKYIPNDKILRPIISTVQIDGGNHRFKQAGHRLLPDVCSTTRHQKVVL